MHIFWHILRLLMLTEKMCDAGGKEILTKTTRYSYDGNGNETGRSVSYTHPHNIGMRRTTRGSIYGDGMEGEFPTLMERTRSTYDGFNRLKQMESLQAGTRTIVEYLYDGDGLRTRKTSRSSDNGYALEVTNYLYDRQHVILETDGEGNLKARYTRGINHISHLDNTNTERFYLYNGHGDVVRTVDIRGNVHNNYEYDIFGNPVLTIENYSNSIRYAGEFLDIETGLYYLRARYYNPYTGRFISEDSYWGETDNPLSLNLYTYCANDPVLCFLRGTIENIVSSNKSV
jgi:RHS repeat-associated protein